MLNVGGSKRRSRRSFDWPPQQSARSIDQPVPSRGRCWSGPRL